MPSTRLGRHRRRRTTAVASVLLAAPALLAGAVGLGASPADAADKIPFVVIGTSDVFDSHLVQAVIEPDFEAANPDYDFQYVSKGTGDALNLARGGAAAAVIVHAASLENQFVQDGYSAEPAGRAVFYGDFVLAGRSKDPAGVTDAGAVSHDIVGAFQKIAAAGAMGKAEFVSRGGTPGTTVQEHQIWALTSGVTLCDVSAANGGGKTPSTVTGSCPSPVPLPSWYHSTGLNQGLNVQNADACNGYTTDQCYVFSDRGTVQYLQTTSPPSIANLQIQVRDNSADAVGGANLLINNFHAYAVNPAKFPDNPGKTDLPTATKLLDLLTSPAEQAKITAYLSSQTSNDPPFIGSARPKLTLTTPPTQVTGNQKVTVSGVLSNSVPGTPALAGETVDLLAVLSSTPDSAPTLVGSDTTGPAGQFSIDYAPRATLDYTVTTGQITKEEYVLTPPFKDLLQATSTRVGTVEELGKVALTKATKVGADKRILQVSGVVAPSVLGSSGKLVLFARKVGAATFAQTGAQPLTEGQTSFTKSFKINPGVKGTFEYQLRYANPGVLTAGSTKTYTVTY